MKTLQILAVGALLAGYAQACTRIRVDQVRIRRGRYLVTSGIFRQKYPTSDKPHTKRSQPVSYFTLVHVTNSETVQRSEQPQQEVKHHYDLRRQKRPVRLHRQIVRSRAFRGFLPDPPGHEPDRLGPRILSGGVREEHRWDREVPADQQLQGK